MTGVVAEVARDRRQRILSWAGLAAILILAASLRWYHIGKEDFWLDEILSVETAMGRGAAHKLLPPDTIIEHAPDFTDTTHPGPWSGIWKNIVLPKVGEPHPPLGFIILRAWGSVFGYGEVAARSLSAVASLLSLLLLYLTARELHGNAIALCACLMMALASTQIDYAQEAKHYALLQAFGMAAALAVVRIEKHGASFARAMGLFAAVTAMLFTHYYAIGAVAAVAAYGVLKLRGRARVFAVASVAAAAAVFVVVWVPQMIPQLRAQTHEDHFFDDTGPDFGRRWIEHIAAVPFRLIAQPLPSSTMISWGMAIIYFLPIALLIWRKRTDLSLWILWLWGVVGFVAASDFACRGWRLPLPRYTLLASPAIFALLAAVTMKMPRLIRYGAPLATALAFLPFISSGWQLHTQQFRSLCAVIDELEQPGTITIFGAAQPLFGYVGYVTTLHYAHHLPGPVIILTKPVTPSLLRQLRGKGPIVYIDVDVRLMDIRNIFPGAREINQRLVTETAIIHRFVIPEEPVTAPASAPPQIPPSTSPTAPLSPHRVG